MKTNRSATQVIPILGDPVAQVATPALWNAVFQDRGQDAICVPLDLPATGLEPFLAWARQARNVPGFLSTTPHKAALAQMCDRLSETARSLGVANTFRLTDTGDLIGEMFDGHGMLDAIEHKGISIAHSAVVICGAGAAGGAIAIEAARRSAYSIAVIDIDPVQASNLTEKLSLVLNVPVATSLPTKADIVVNASPAGSPAIAPPPFTRDLISNARCVADALTEPEETELLRMARQAGVAAVTGRDMAECQASRMRSFLGLEPT